MRCGFAVNGDMARIALKKILMPQHRACKPESFVHSQGMITGSASSQSVLPIDSRRAAQCR